MATHQFTEPTPAELTFAKARLAARRLRAASRRAGYPHSRERAAQLLGLLQDARTYRTPWPNLYPPRPEYLASELRDFFADWWPAIDMECRRSAMEAYAASLDKGQRAFRRAGL